MSFRVTTSDVTKAGTVGNGGSARVEKSGPFESAARRVASSFDPAVRDGLPSLTARSSFAASRSVSVDRSVSQFA